MRARLLLLGLMLTAPSLAAQSSMFGVRGLGLPGRELSARALGSDGAIGLFDPESSLNPASISGLGVLTAGFALTPDWRTWSSPAGNASLRATRFPLAYVGGPVPGSRLSLAIGFASYADHDFALASVGTFSPRGQAVTYYDTLTSTGGLSQFRFAAAYRLDDATTIGAAAYAITGSNRVITHRYFSDSSYLPILQRTEMSYAGPGFSLGLTHRFSSAFSGALLLRSDGAAKLDIDSTRVGTIDLPYTFGAGFTYRASRKLQLAGQGIYQTWSGANSDLLALGGVGSVNTLDVSAGLEFTPDPRRPTRHPLRFGVRYAGLPFPLEAGARAHEFSIATGTGARFARGRGGMDLGLQYAWRSDGSARKERALLLTLGISVRP